MTNDRDVLAFVRDCFATLYHQLGERAPTVTSDACVVRLYEAGRAFGDIALAISNELGEATEARNPFIEDTLERASGDETGAMMLFALVSVIGPRLLISLRDARDAPGAGEDAGTLLGSAAQVLVREMFAAGEVAGGCPVVHDEDWQATAQHLDAERSDGRFSESLGLFH